MVNSQEENLKKVVVVVVPLEMSVVVVGLYDFSFFVPILFDSLQQCELWRRLRHDEWNDG